MLSPATEHWSGRVAMGLSTAELRPSAVPRGGPVKAVRSLATSPATPDRLRRVGAVLALGCVLFALVSLLSGLSRAAAVQDGGTRVSALNADAAELYQSLADADAMATSGFVAGGLEPVAVRTRYDDDIGRAAERLAQAAGRLPEGDPAQQPIDTISAQLPVYTGLIETARVYNRQGLPLGQSYLDSGSRLMRETVLPAADELRRLQAAALDADYRGGGAVPYAVLLIGIAAVAAIGDAGLREWRRTNRVLSLGLLAAAAALSAALLWWVVALLLTGGNLSEAERHSDAATALDDARAAVLQARSNESLVLVARSGGGASEAGFTGQLERVLGPPEGAGGLLGVAAETVPATQLDQIRVAAVSWQDAHRALRGLDDGGNYRAAVASATGADPAGSGSAFERLDAALGDAADAERRAFDADLDAAAATLTAISSGPALLALIAATAAAAGIGRRVGEYR
jgi:hypothetical protein